MWVVPNAINAPSPSHHHKITIQIYRWYVDLPLPAMGGKNDILLPTFTWALERRNMWLGVTWCLENNKKGIFEYTVTVNMHKYGWYMSIHVNLNYPISFVIKAPLFGFNTVIALRNTWLFRFRYVLLVAINYPIVLSEPRQSAEQKVARNEFCYPLVN